MQHDPSKVDHGPTIKNPGLRKIDRLDVFYLICKFRH
jgi:hypothetical protein